MRTLLKLVQNKEISHVTPHQPCQDKDISLAHAALYLFKGLKYFQFHLYLIAKTSHISNGKQQSDALRNYHIWH